MLTGGKTEPVIENVPTETVDDTEKVDEVETKEDIFGVNDGGIVPFM